MKLFKGVIAQWELAGNRVHGVVVRHTEHDGHADDSGLEWIKPGHRVCTSEVVSICKIEGSAARLCETRNSIYVLI